MDKKIIDIKLLDIIGTGGFSTVCKVQMTKTGKYLAAKKIIYDNDSLLVKNEILREIHIISLLSHQCIIKFYGYSKFDFNHENNPVLFFEYMPNGTLNDIIKLEEYGNPPSKWNETKKLINIYGIAYGMQFLHSKKIIHRDLKPANILEDENLYPKISDFGLSKYCVSNDKESSLVGTIAYMAPEVLEGGFYSNKIDVFSFAMTVYQLMTTNLPILEQSPFKHSKKIIEGERPNFNVPIPESYKKLIIECWQQDSLKRPSFEEIVKKLKTDPGFITDNIDKEEFYNFIEYVESNEIEEENLNENVFEFEINVVNSNVKEKPLVLNANNIDLKKFEKKERIGGGLCGEVYKIINIDSKSVFAAKIMKNEFYEKNKDSPESKNLLREVRILSQLTHPSIMKFYGYSPTDFIEICRPVIVTEYIKNGTLEDVIEIERSNIKIPFWNDTMKLINIYGIAACMAYLHSKDIIHRDLKPINILVDDFLFPKLADFGFSKNLSQISNDDLDAELKKSGLMGTDGFMAPEIWDQRKYSKASDVYSFAMIVYEILSKEYPFYGKENCQVMYLVLFKKERPKLKSSIPLHYKKLIKKCWLQDPNKRPTFEMIVHQLETNPDFYSGNINKKQYFDYVQMIKQFQKEQTILFSIKSDSFEKYSLEQVYTKMKENKSSFIKEGFLQIDKYIKQGEIRENKVSSFYFVADKMSGQIFSAEISKFEINFLSPNEKNCLSKEVETLTKLKHPSIQQIIGYSLTNFKHHPKPVIIREYSINQTLFEILENERKNESTTKLNDTQKLIIIYGIASGMSYLHEHDVLHHELKTKSILIDDGMKPKISEFGFYIKPQNSRKFKSESIGQLNDEVPYFVSPEVLQSEDPTKSSDVYSFAFVIYEILSNEIPFMNIKDQKDLFNEIVIKCNRPSLNDKIQPIYQNLISSCWSQNPKERPEFNSIVNELKTNKEFINDKIDKQEFLNYIKYIDEKTQQSS